MRIALIGLALLAAGCATRTLEQEIAMASNVDLCEVFLYGNQNMTDTVRPEVFRRNINCRDFEAAIQHRQQLRAISASRPAPVYTPYQLPAPPTSPRTTCTTERVGNTLQTVCR